MLGTIGWIKGNLMSSSDLSSKYNNENFYPGNPALKPSYPSVPKEYTQYDYLETDAQYGIRTNYYPCADTVIEMKVRRTAHPAYTTKTDRLGVLFCCEEAGSANGKASFTLSSSYETGSYGERNELGISIGALYLRYTGATIDINKDYTIKASKNAVILNDKTVLSPVPNAKLSVRMQNPLRLLGPMSDEIHVATYCSTVNFHGRMYSCKIYEQSELVRDFVPVQRNSDNYIGVFDKVTQKAFFFKSGSQKDCSVGNIS